VLFGVREGQRFGCQLVVGDVIEMRTTVAKALFNINKIRSKQKHEQDKQIIKVYNN